MFGYGLLLIKHKIMYVKAIDDIFGRWVKLLSLVLTFDNRIMRKSPANQALILLLILSELLEKLPSK